MSYRSAEMAPATASSRACVDSRSRQAGRLSSTCFRAARLPRKSGGGHRELWVLNDTEGGSRRGPKCPGIAGHTATGVRSGSLHSHCSYRDHLEHLPRYSYVNSIPAACVLIRESASRRSIGAVACSESLARARVEVVASLYARKSFLQPTCRIQNTEYIQHDS